MRIYKGDFTVRRIIEDCKVTTRGYWAAGQSFGGTVELDLDLLNQRLSELPIEEIQQRRSQLRVLYEILMSLEGTDQGIHITTVLLELAYCKVVENNSESMR